MDKLLAKHLNHHPSRVADKIITRLPDGLRDRLKKAAKINERTVTGEVVHRLKKSLEADGL